MSLYLCVDCGGSKTSAAICNSAGTILSRALGGPSNFSCLPLDQFTSTVSNTIITALSSLNLPLSPTPFAAASFGVSGVDSPTSIASITPALSALLNIPPDRIHITNDTHLLATPLLTHPDTSHAITVIGGTGAIAVSFRRNLDGNGNGAIEELARVGGWGWILGDEGGGFSVGREALRLILLDHDQASVRGLPPTESTLTKRVLEIFGVRCVPEIFAVVYLPDPHADPSKREGEEGKRFLDQPREKRLSSLSPLVFEAAFEDNDVLALRIVRMCAGNLAEKVGMLLGDGIQVEDPSRIVKARESVISFGGSLVGIEKYRKMVLEDLERRGHVFRYVEFIDDAAGVGAVGLAAAARQKVEV